MHSRLRVKKEKRAGAWDLHGGGGGSVGGGPMTRSNSRVQDDVPAAPAAGPLTTSSGGAVGAGLATRLGLALLRALALLRPAAAVFELLARALRLIASAVATRGRTQRQRELLQWLRRGDAAGAEEVQELGAIWRNGRLLCAAVNAAVPGACCSAATADAAGHTACDFSHAQHIANKYLGVAPVFSETEVQRAAAGGKAPAIRRLERYLRAVRRAANRLQFAVNNPAVAWTLPQTSPSPPQAPAAAATDDDESSEGVSAANWTRHRARGTGLVAAMRGRRALFTVLLPSPSQQPQDLLIQVQGPSGDVGQKLIRAPTFQAGSKAPNENDGCVSTGSSRRATFSLKPWFSASESRRNDAIPVETRVSSGSVKVCYVPRSAGLHQVSLLSQGRHIAESPYNVMVDARAGAADAPDFMWPWWTAAGRGASDESKLRDSARRVRIVYRVVDFVTEKMLLTNDGKLQKIPPNAPPPLLRALSLPDLHQRPAQSSEDSESSDSDSDTFYDSQSEACASLAPSPSLSQSPHEDSPKPKRDPEFFRKQYRKVLHMCRFLTQNKPNRRSLEILSTAGRLLDGRPVRLPPEFPSLLARIISEGISSAQRIETRDRGRSEDREDRVTHVTTTSADNAGLNSISELMEFQDDNHTRASRDFSDRIDDVFTSECNDPVPEDAGSSLENTRLYPHLSSSVKQELDCKLDAQDDDSVKFLQETLESTSKMQPMNEGNLSDDLHVLNADSAHNSLSEETNKDYLHPLKQELQLNQLDNNLVECSDNVSNEVVLPCSQPLQEQQIITETEIDSSVSLQQITPAPTHLLQEGDNLNLSNRRRPDSGINLSKTVTQSGTKRPNVLQLSSTFAPHHFSDSARVGIDGQKNRSTEKKNYEVLEANLTSNVENESKYMEMREGEIIKLSAETTIENSPLQGKKETKVPESIKTTLNTENDNDELDKIISDPIQEGTIIIRALPDNIPESTQYTTLNDPPGEHEVQLKNETNSVMNVLKESYYSPYEMQTDKFDKHFQFPGRPPEHSSSNPELQLNRNEDDLFPKENATESESEAGEELEVSERSCEQRQECKRPPAPPSSPSPARTPPIRCLVPRGEPPAEPAPSPPIPRDVPQRAPRDVGAALDRPPPNLDAVLSAASLEEALARFELELQEADPANASPQGGSSGRLGSSNGTSSCRSWDKGDSDYVSMEDVQSSLHHSPEGGQSGPGVDLAEDWMRFLAVDYGPERLGPAEEEIWSSIARAQDPNDHPVSDWVSNLMPSNRYHPRVLSPGIYPMTSIKEESEDRSAPPSPTSPTPSPFKLLDTQRSLHNSSPFLSVTSPSPENTSQKEEEPFDSFEWRPQIMATEEQVVVRSLIDLDNTVALKADIDSANKSLGEDENKPDNGSPPGDLLDFLLPSPEVSGGDENESNETLSADKVTPQEFQGIPEVIDEECNDKVNSTKKKDMSRAVLNEGNNSKLGDIDIEEWNNAIDEYLAPSSLDSWESLKHPEQFNTPSCEEDASLNGTVSQHLPSTETHQDNIFRDDWDQCATNESTSPPRGLTTVNEPTESIPSVEENHMNKDHQGEISCCSSGLITFFPNNQATNSITVPEILIEDIDLLLTPCVSPQLNSSFEEIENDEDKERENSHIALRREEDQRYTLLHTNISGNQAFSSTGEIEVHIPKTSPTAKPEAGSDHLENIGTERDFNFDFQNSETNKISDVTAKSKRLECKFRDATKENCSISQWPVETSTDIVPSPIRVTQWKQFWDQKAAAQKRKDEFKTSGVQRTIKRGSTHLEYLKCCHLQASPQRKRQHPSIRIPGIVSKWRKSFENVVDANKVAREFMKIRSVKTRKSILPSYNVDQDQILPVDDTKSITNSPQKVVSEEDNSVGKICVTSFKATKEKHEWPESNLVTSRKKKFEIGEPVSPERILHDADTKSVTNSPEKVYGKVQSIEPTGVTVFKPTTETSEWPESNLVTSRKKKFEIGEPVSPEKILNVDDSKSVTNSPVKEIRTKDKSVEKSGARVFKPTQEKCEWPESNLVTSRKKKFEIGDPVAKEQILHVDDTKSVTNSPERKVSEEEKSVEITCVTVFKATKEKYEWPESNLVTSRKKKFEFGEPVSEERRNEYFKTIPPRNKVTKVAEYRKFWDSISKGQSCVELDRDVSHSGLMITEEIIIDVPSLDTNTSTVISEPKPLEKEPTMISYDLAAVGEQTCLNEESRSTSDFESIDVCSTSKVEVSRQKENTCNNFESVSESSNPNNSAMKIISQHASQDEATTLQQRGLSPEPMPPKSPEEQPVTPRRLHIVSAEEIWYKARRIPIEEVEGLSSGSDELSRSLDESDQSWSIVEEGAESQPDSLPDTCGHRPIPPPLPPPSTSVRANRSRAAANRGNREARSRFENAKLFFQNLELGVSVPPGMGAGRRSKGRRLRGGTDLDTSTDDTGSEGGSVRLPRTRRRGGGIQARPSGGAQSDTETLLSRVRVPRGLFHDVRSGGVPQSRELLAALAAVDSRPASPYEEVAAAAASGSEDLGGVTLAPSPSPPASPAPHSPLPHAYDAEYPYLPATDPRNFRPRSTLKSFALGGVHIPAFQDL